MVAVMYIVKALLASETGPNKDVRDKIIHARDQKTSDV